MQRTSPPSHRLRLQRRGDMQQNEQVRNDEGESIHAFTVIVILATGDCKESSSMPWIEAPPGVEADQRPLVGPSAPATW